MQYTMLLLAFGHETLQQHGMMLDKVYPAHNKVNFPFVKFDITFDMEVTCVILMIFDHNSVV